MVDVTPFVKYKAMQVEPIWGSAQYSPFSTKSNAKRFSTERNMRVSPLLLLPRELRDYIWEYVLGSYLIFNTQPERPLAMAHDSDRYIKHPLAILRVCRSTYPEARFVPFTINNFWYKHTHPRMPSDVNVWWRKLMPTQFNAVRNVLVFLGRDINDTDVLQVEALAPLVGLRTIVFRVYAGYTGTGRDIADEKFQFIENKLVERLKEVLCAEGVTIIFQS